MKIISRESFCIKSNGFIYGRCFQIWHRVHCSRRKCCRRMIFMGARRGGGGKLPPPTEKIVVEKWCYFPELCKMTEVREEGRENGEKVNFPLRFLYVNFKIFSKNFNSYWFLAETRKNFKLPFLNSFRIIKDFH